MSLVLIFTIVGSDFESANHLAEVLRHPGQIGGVGVGVERPL
jgi:hypothetical protein